MDFLIEMGGVLQKPGDADSKVRCNERVGPFSPFELKFLNSAVATIVRQKRRIFQKGRYVGI